MNRFENFVNAYIVCLIGFIIFIFVPYIDSIITAAFMFSMFTYIFVREEKVEKAKLLKDPKIHFYHKSRSSMYGYIMVAGGVVSIFLFYFLNLNLNVRLGVSVLIAWPFLIGLSLWATNYTNRFIILDSISDYMYIIMNKKMDIKQIDKLTKRYFYMKLSDIKPNALKDEEIPEDLRTKFYVEFIRYINENFINSKELVSEEIKELNEKSKDVV